MPSPLLGGIYITSDFCSAHRLDVRQCSPGLTAARILGNTNLSMYFPVHLLVLLPTVCHQFTACAPLCCFCLATYLTRQDFQSCLRSHGSLAATFFPEFSHYVLDILPSLDIALGFITYGMDPYGNERTVHIMKPRTRCLQDFRSRRATIFALSI
jgi:hypothetical protein